MYKSIKISSTFEFSQPLVYGGFGFKLLQLLRWWQRGSIAARPVSLEDGGQLLPQIPREHKTNATSRDEVVTGPVGGANISLGRKVT